MRINYSKFRKLIREVLSESINYDIPESHLTMTGKEVSFGCNTCVVDLDRRIEDAKSRRDSCTMRSDSREHYNGILKVLRRELRAARKLNDTH